MEAAESTGTGSEEWALAHEALSKLHLKRAALDAEEGRWLLRAFRAATHVYFGYASFGEYIERLFGLSRRATEEKLRVAGALETLPELAEALRSGKLNWSVVRELSRVAVSETEREWILAARRKTARQVERMVSGLAPGDRPADRRRSELVRHILRLEVGAETLATFREAMKELRKRSDHRLGDDAALLLMAREVLGGPGDAGRASYQLVVTQCEDCGRGFQHANGELIELDPAIVEMCRCDAQDVPVAPVHGVTLDAPDSLTANAGKRAGADAHMGLTDEAAGAHESVSDELAGGHESVSDERADARAGARAHMGLTDDVADVRASVSDERAGADAHMGLADEVADVRAGVRDERAGDHAHTGITDERAGADAHTGHTDEVAGARAGVIDELAGAYAGITDERAGARFARIDTGNGDELERAASAVRGTGEVRRADVSPGRGAREVTRAEAPLRRGAGEFAPAQSGTGREAGGAPAGLKRRRATQRTPLAIRREVFWRDRGRCVVPGCRNATFVDLHHLELRSEGGENDPDNLVVLCGAHHGAVHRGRLRIDGKVSTGLRVRHADGTVYGFVLSPASADASARVFAGLRSLGFSEKSAWASLEQALSSAPAHASVETLLRSAVARASCR
jgi:hypothetical protein